MNTKEFLKAELDKLDKNAYWEIDGYGNTEFVCKVMELYANAVNKNAVSPLVSKSVCLHKHKYKVQDGRYYRPDVGGYDIE